VISAPSWPISAECPAGLEFREWILPFTPFLSFAQLGLLVLLSVRGSS